MPPIIQNKKANFEYEIIEKFEAGIVLESGEVKSLRKGSATISEAYITYKAPHIIIMNMYIAQYENLKNETRRNRILLLKKKEINKLLNYTKKKGATIIPLELFWNKKGFAKIVCASATGKKQYDKRASIKEKEWNRTKEIAIKNFVINKYNK